MPSYRDPHSVDIDLDPRDRDQGLLTYDMREFLIGEKEAEGSTYAQTRQRIRDRVRNGFADFEYLQHLNEQDRNTVFGDLTAPPWSLDDSDETTRAMGRGIEHAFAFLYDGIEHQSSATFETYLENGLGRVTRATDERTYLPTVDATIHISWTSMTNLTTAKKRLREGEELEEEILGSLIKHGDLSDEDWINIRKQYEDWQFGDSSDVKS